MTARKIRAFSVVSRPSRVDCQWPNLRSAIETISMPVDCQAGMRTHSMSTISGNWLAASASVSDSTILSSSLLSDALSIANRNEISNMAVELSLSTHISDQHDDKPS